MNLFIYWVCFVQFCIVSLVLFVFIVLLVMFCFIVLLVMFSFVLPLTGSTNSIATNKHIYALKTTKKKVRNFHSVKMLMSKQKKLANFQVLFYWELK